MKYNSIKNATTNQIIATVLLLLISIHALAKNTINWQDLSHDQYIDELVECKITLDELRWSYNLWPKENKKAKPLFTDIVDIDQIRQSVLKSLKIQAVLADIFSFEITPEMLQHDLGRMASNTQNAKQLKHMFAVLNNNPETIAQCISRPYLVQKKLTNQFNYNNTIHSEARLTAQAELDNYLESNNTDNLIAQTHTVTYKIKTDDKNKLIDELSDEITINLDGKEFSQKLQQLENTNIQEQETAFIYTEILEQNHDNIKVQVLQWQKQHLHVWLQTQADTEYLQLHKDYNYSLPIITGLNENFNNKVEPIETWGTEPYFPTHRDHHIAVWSGNYMIVWGGYDGNPLNTGGRYDPVTDTWQATSTGSNVPTARYYHTGVWSGSHMIVWGGTDGSYLNTGGLYDPVTDVWQATSTGANVPTAVGTHTAVWTGSQMIVWGGFNGSYLNTGGRYDPVTDVWQPTSTGANVPTGRYLHTTVWTGSQMIVWGGDGSGGELNTGGVYDPVTDVWQATSIGSNVPTVRRFHTAVWADNQMIVWGGLNNSTILNTGGRYDPDTDVWQTTSTSANAPSNRFYHTAVWSGSQMIIWGGYDGHALNTGVLYNPDTDVWEQATTDINAPNGRYYHTAVWNGSQMMVWGGSAASSPLNTGGHYDPATDVWQTIAANYIIGGTLSGLNSAQVIIQNNGGDDLTLTANGSFVFSNLINGNYEVTVLSNPTTPNQTCAVTGGTNGDGSGSISNANENTITVTCTTNQYTIGGTVSGMHPGNPNTMVLQNNNGNDLTINNDGSFVFSTSIDDASSYNVTILSEPDSPIQSCSVVNGDSSIAGADVDNIQINCQYGTDLIIRHGFE